tara:strand:- start:86 stop:442 length:357 start_codon:yes stop_codon:yes gene_type:complete
MKDGRVNKCKGCSKLDVAAHRASNIEKIREYDRGRGNRQSHSYLREWREKYPKKYKAHNMVNNCIRDKKLHSEPCCVCGDKKSVAHHDDYDKPLNVRWMCQAHHKQWHEINGDGLNSL